MNALRLAAVSALIIAASVGAAAAVDSSIGPAGQVIVDGKPTVPIAVWTQPTYLFEYYRQMGVTCVISPTPERGPFLASPRDVLGDAEKHSLGVISHSYRRRWGRGRAADHPAVWGWMGGYAEPENPERLRRSFTRTKQADASRFMMVNIKIDDFIVGKHREFYTEAMGCTDAVISHVWPELRDPTTHNLRNVATFVDLVRTYCKDREGGEVSIWVELNPHKWKLKDREGGAEFRAPTLAEFRFQVWLALIHGADGICIFPISFDPFVYSQIPAKAESEIARNAALIRKMTPALVAEPSELAIEAAPDKPEGIVDVTTRQVDGTHYVFVLNGGREPQTVTVTAPDLGSKWQAVDAITDRPAAVTEGAVRRKLEGLQLSIWQLRPVAPRAEDSE